jgi:hypothetical protein
LKIKICNFDPLNPKLFKQAEGTSQKCNKVKGIYWKRMRGYQYCAFRPNNFALETFDVPHEKLAATAPRNAVAISGLRPQLFKNLTYNATVSKNRSTM